ncbi:cytochrome P450 [Streptomyces sp. L2]|uniref:cytochrome P450 n=1 Tax=Streptomyces sp. L2 TaxID=2162665 RepID=UPI00101041A0|nr:cytochrome P450 [Streptomyces sp. L2]
MATTPLDLSAGEPARGSAMDDRIGQAGEVCAAGTPGCPAANRGGILHHGAGDPTPLYAHLRACHPVFHDPLLDVWVVSRHQDVVRAFRDTPRDFTNQRTFEPLCPLAPQAQAVLAATAMAPAASSLDPPEHTRLRQTVNAAFPTTGRRVNGVDSLLQARATAHATALAGRPSRGGDLVADYARPLCLATLGHLTGVPDTHHPAIAAQAAAMTVLVADRLTPARQAEAAHAFSDLWAFCQTLVHDTPRLAPGSLLPTLLAHRPTNGAALTPDEAASVLMEMLITTAEVMPKLITNTLHRHLGPREHPERPQPSGLRALHRTELIDRAIADTLRHATPLIGWLRATTRPLHLADTPVPAHAKLMLLLGSACQDAPPTAPTPVFGAGIHYCPGARYALRLTRHALAALTRACPDLTLTEPVTHGPGSTTPWPLNALTRGPAQLSATW